jgi:ATP-dependent DNA ligase
MPLPDFGSVQSSSDGEAVWCGADERTDFDKLHSHCYEDDVTLYGFDLLELNSEDYRQHPLEHNNRLMKDQK